MFNELVNEFALNFMNDIFSVAKVKGFFFFFFFFLCDCLSTVLLSSHIDVARRLFCEIK